ncbi:MAG: sigma-70 family RNA polymerase sigma factor [Bacteroidota bacterium]
MKQDTAIISAIANGDREAFRKLYHLFAEKVYNTALSFVKNEQEAEEVTQDVFTKVFQNAHQFKGDASPSTWIYRIAVNTSLNLIKKKKRFTLVDLSNAEKEIPQFDHPGVLMEKRENARLLFEVIDTLPDNQRTAFILSFVEDLPRQEVANIMELSLKAVESLLQRAKGNLRKVLEKSYPNRRKKR